MLANGLSVPIQKRKVGGWRRSHGWTVSGEEDTISVCAVARAAIEWMINTFYTIHLSRSLLSPVSAPRSALSSRTLLLNQYWLKHSSSRRTCCLSSAMPVENCRFYVQSPLSPNFYFSLIVSRLHFILDAHEIHVYSIYGPATISLRTLMRHFAQYSLKITSIVQCAIHLDRHRRTFFFLPTYNTWLWFVSSFVNAVERLYKLLKLITTSCSGAFVPCNTHTT